MVELRKRPPPKETAVEPPAAKRSASKPRATTKAEAAKSTKQTSAKAKLGKPAGKAADKSKAKDTGADVAAPDATTEKNKTTAKKSAVPAESSKDSKVEREIPKAEEKEGNEVEGEAAEEEATLPLSVTSVGKTLDSNSTLLTSSFNLSSSATETTTLSSLISSSNTKGLIIFTYPKASTPGCTTQACLFRDSYQPLLSKGYKVYGCSMDSVKANGNFALKQNLGFDLISDDNGKAGVVRGLGMGKSGGAKGTLRGVVCLEKVEGDGKVKIKGWMQGGPQTTLDRALEWVG